MTVPQYNLSKSTHQCEFAPTPPTATVIASRKAAHPRVASLAPAGQFTFWESPATYVRRFYREIATALTGFAMTVIVVGWCFCLGWAVIRPGLR